MSFKNFLENKENQDEVSKDWRKHFIQLEKGFIPPAKLRPIIAAFTESGKIELTNDTSKAPTMPKKSLFLVGGPVRDFLLNKTIKDYDLATNATPEQVGHILHNAGFEMTPERSGKPGKELNLTFQPKMAEKGSRKLWYIKGRDASQDNKAFVIGAVVDGEEFDIATFRKDAKVTDGQAEVDFVDNPHEDASRRDLTINALYIELTKPDGENSKLYDPTGKGFHDVRNGVVRTVGPAEDRFNEDKLRVMRAIRFHCRFGGKPKMDEEIERALPKFKNLEGVAFERIRDEFLKGLTHPDVDTKCYIGIYKRTGLLQKIFPELVFESPNGIPYEWTDKKDKILALAWLLQHNSPDKVDAMFAGNRGNDPSGWTTQERRGVVFLLRLKEFTPDEMYKFLKNKAGTGLSSVQIKEWVSMFNIAGTNKNKRPWWAKHVNAFADYQPSVKWTPELDPQGMIPPEKRGSIIAAKETENFKKQIQ